MPLFFGYGLGLKRILASVQLRAICRMAYAATLCFPIAFAFYYSMIDAEITLYMQKIRSLLLCVVANCFVFAFAFTVLIEQPARKIVKNFIFTPKTLQKVKS